MISTVLAKLLFYRFRSAFSSRQRIPPHCNRRALCSFLLISILSTSTFTVQSAEKESNQLITEKYTIHYHVFNSDALTPDNAKKYKLKRARNVALVNVTVIDNLSGEAFSSIPARIAGFAYNLLGQQKELAFKEVKEGGSIYYIANFRHSHEERLSFNLTVRPIGEKENISLAFKHTVYISLDDK